MRNIRIQSGVWLERLTTVALLLLVAGSIYRAFWSPLTGDPNLRTFSQLQRVANELRQESNPVRREGKTASGTGRLLDTLTPTNARIFFLEMLGPENFAQIGYYQYLTYYLLPRELAISSGRPPVLRLDGFYGRSPASVEELKQAGYDFTFKSEPDRTMAIPPLGSMRLRPSWVEPTPVPGGDGLIALLLPLAVAIVGRRIVRWLFPDLRGILTAGELLAGGLGLGAFFLTQLALGLRLAGVRWERALTALILIWAVGEVVVLVRRLRAPRPRLQARTLWWLVLLPAGLVLGCQFRLAGLLGIQEFDAVANWALKAKILHYFAGPEMWTWFRNPALAYAHMDYPLLVPLLHVLTYAALGHVNDFVIKFWNQWMLLLLAWAVLGVGRFPGKRPWLAALVVLALVLLPMTRLFALKEGATIPMLFYSVLGSMQLAIGLAEQQAGRLRLGLLLLLAAVMVKFEGMMLLGLWIFVLALDRDSRSVFWPLRRVGWAGIIGMAAWLPYAVFRLHGPVPHPESGWVGQLLTNAGSVFYMAPMTWVAWVSRRFLENDFASWGSPDHLHAVWQGQWLGLQSLVDQMTQGAGWVCVLLLVLAWCRGGRLRATMFRLFLVSLLFVTLICLVWCAVRSTPMDYNAALLGSEVTEGGRYLYPILLSWVVAGVILLLRDSPGDLIGSVGQPCAGNTDPPALEHLPCPSPRKDHGLLTDDGGPRT